MKYKLIIAIVIVVLISIYGIYFMRERALSEIINISDEQIKTMFLYNYQGTEVLSNNPDELKKISESLSKIRVRKSFDEPSLKIRQQFKFTNNSEKLFIEVANTGKIKIERSWKEGNSIKEHDYGYFIILNDAEYYNLLDAMIVTQGKPSGTYNYSDY